MPTECSQDSFDFGTVEGRAVVGAFDGGAITSDGGALLLGATDKAIGLVARFARCFSDARAPTLIEHSIETLVGQRIFGLALGYEDLNDHDQLRHDPVLATLAGKLQARREDCAPLAGKSTLNRLEQSLRGGVGRYHKIGHDPAAIDALFVELFLDAHSADAGGHPKRRNAHSADGTRHAKRKHAHGADAGGHPKRHREPPDEIVLDLDATDDPLHGQQEGRFFHGYYDAYCYLPLYVFCGRHLLAAKLRRANIDAAHGAREEVARIVTQIRRRWPRVRIILRADSGFCRDDLMSWCEANHVDYVFGLARNPRLVRAIRRDLALARATARQTRMPARRFVDLDWSTRDSWSRERRVVAKAEWITGKSNPRFVVTSLKRSRIGARRLYEDLYCQRGDMENRIKECQADLFADRTPASTMRTNQLRLWLASMAYVLVCALRRIGLAGTDFAEATCGTIRLRLLKIAALVTRSVRRVKVALASACPNRDIFAIAAHRLRCAGRQARLRQDAA